MLEETGETNEEFQAISKETIATKEFKPKSLKPLAETKEFEDSETHQESQLQSKEVKPDEQDEQQTEESECQSAPTECEDQLQPKEVKPDERDEQQTGEPECQSAPTECEDQLHVDEQSHKEFSTKPKQDEDTCKVDNELEPRGKTPELEVKPAPENPIVPDWWNAGFNPNITFNNAKCRVHYESNSIYSILPIKSDSKLFVSLVKCVRSATLSGESEREFKQEDFENEMGLSFNSTKALITGVPKLYGQFKITFSITPHHSLPPKDVEVKLIVNPDPRDLWSKEIEPDKDSPYRKNHHDSFYTITNDDLVIGYASVRGRSHAKDGTHRDDDCSIAWNLEGGWNLLCVADGAGSAKLSRKGSKITIETVKSYLSDKLREDEEELQKLNDSGQGVIEDGKFRKDDWSILIRAAKKALKKLVEESTGDIKLKDFYTTVLICVFKDFGDKRFFVSFCVGDGAIGVITDKNASPKLLSVPDSGQFAGETTFLNSPNVLNDNKTWSRLKVALAEKPCALFAMTDGVSDPLLPTENDLINPGKWESMINDPNPSGGDINEDPEGAICKSLKGKDCPSLGNIIDSLNQKSEKKGKLPELARWLYFWSKGNHDDRTIAFAADKDFLTHYGKD
jgi:serine/threonine protein phosphatase PrpC